jgi:glycosyltransferase involved in cell wall biosynthesis
MNVCLIGNFLGSSDEGMKGVAQSLAGELEKIHNVLRVNIYNAISFDTFDKINNFSPDVLHYLSGPSPFSFIILRALLLACKVQSHHPVCSVMTATQPWLPFNSISFLKKLKPDLLLIQSDQTEKYFRPMDFCLEYLPNGVDEKKFKPTSDGRKKSLRNKYGLKDNEFVVLHIGPVRANRGLDVLKQIAKKKNCRVLIVGSTSSRYEKTTFLDLVKSGCVVWRKYIRSIQEIYQLSDLYVFPVRDRLGSIECPLSVLEAMSCNLPVITTKFGGLSRMFTEGAGLFFVDNLQQMTGLIEDIQNCDVRELGVCTRKKIMQYSWDNIARSLSKYYSQLSCRKK